LKKIPDRYSKKSSLIKPVIIGSVKSFILFFLFYKSFVLSFILALIYGIINIKTYEKRRIEEWRWQMDLEFREVMTGISSALNAGYSVENSFKEAKMDLLLLYGNNSVMVKELDIINSKLMLNQPLENVLMEFARRCEVEDINNFAEVFQTAKRTGGNLIDIARSSADKISNKIETSREIRTMVSGKRMEGRIMALMPLAIIIYFWISSPGFLDCLYAPAGRPIMTVLLIIYVAAYKWSERIGDITV
jgi:Flp pilus assembly protein TadB